MLVGWVGDPVGEPRPGVCQFCLESRDGEGGNQLLPLGVSRWRQAEVGGLLCQRYI